jgi:hypothetical protein
LRRGIDAFSAVEQAFDRKNLNFRVIFIVPELGGVSAGIGDFGAHLFAWLLQRDQNAAGSFLILNVAEQGRDIAAIHSAAFDLDDDFFSMDRLGFRQRLFAHATGNLFSLGFVKVEKTIHASIGAFALAFFQRTRTNQRQRPMLKLEFVELSESLCAFEISWLPFFFEFDLLAEGIFQATLNQIDREIGDVDADPLSPKLLRCVNRRAAAAKRIEHNIAGIA